MLGHVFPSLCTQISAIACSMTRPTFFRLTIRDDDTPQTLEALLQERQTQEETEVKAVRERGYGPTSALANLRLFDAPEGTGACNGRMRHEITWSSIAVRRPWRRHLSRAGAMLLQLFLVALGVEVNTRYNV